MKCNLSRRTDPSKVRCVCVLFNTISLEFMIKKKEINSAPYPLISLIR